MTERFRVAEKSDMPELLELYEEARAFMQLSGNPDQWGKSRYPKRELLEEDIALRRLYVLERKGVIAVTQILTEKR